MATLSKRATDDQKVILKVIDGAIRNAQHAHPEIQLTPSHRRSIAKRAAGTLSALWDEKLARERQSEGPLC